MLAKTYSTRASLEEAVLLLPDINGVTIMGTSEELARLQLSDGSKIHGILCVATDKQATQTFEKPNRGEIKKHGINLNTENV